MSGFEPGEGWREIDVSSEEAAVHAIYQLAEYDEYTGALKRAWVRVPPVPPLPTAPWTVIRGTMPSGGLLTCILNESGQWWDSRGIAWRDVRKFVDGFEVLAEPRKPQPLSDQDFADKVRRETAKAVLDRVLHLDSWGDGIPIQNIEALAREFGVSA